MPRVSQPLAQLLFSKTGWHAMYNAAHTQRSVTLPRVALESMGKHKGFLYVAAASHPYTQGLLAALPALTGPRRRLTAIPGTVPDPWNVPPGCRFAPRCPVAESRCGIQSPPVRHIGLLHRASCHLAINSGSSVWALPRAAE